jgi:AhpC/TSA family
MGADPEGSRSSPAKYQLPFPLLSDPDRKVMQAWGAYRDKMMYGKRTKGVIRSTVWIGPDGVVCKQWPKVSDAAKHPRPGLGPSGGAVAEFAAAAGALPSDAVSTNGRKTP